MDRNNIPRLIFCSGMTRSASRWSYETCQELEKRQTPADKFSKGYLGENKNFIDSTIAKILTLNDGAAVFASHAFSPRALEIIKHGIAKNIYTHRDPRDSIASSMRMDHEGYAHAFSKIAISLNLFDKFLEDGNSLILAYSNILKKPLAVTAAISEYLEIELTSAELTAINAETQRLAIQRRNEQRRKSATNPDDVKVIDQGLETLHGRTSDAPDVINPWRYSALTETDYIDATRRLRPWLKKMNYSTLEIPPWKKETK